MSLRRMTSDPKAMDVHLYDNCHQFVNGGARKNSRASEDAILQSLSQAEQECILFFEETIDSLEESLEDVDGHQAPEQPRTSSTPIYENDGHHALPSSSSHGPVSSLHHMANSSRDHDIIDLVRPEPDLVQTRETPFNPSRPDFQSMMVNPESHYENKPSSVASSSYGPMDGHSAYHPPGCVPTPVLIAQKIAENQGGGTSNFNPSSILRRLSLESDRPLSFATDHGVRQGPPTSAKPSRFPGNINVMLGAKEHHNVANINLHERRAQMLANLTGTSHPLEQEQPEMAASLQRARNMPTRSVSFRDPTPDKSRMEALSKLGLTRNRASTGETSDTNNPGTPPPVTGTENTPVVTSPVIPAPAIPAPVIPAPVTPAPVIPAPVIPAPVIPAPVIPAPVIPAPVIPAPVIPAPVIPAPVIPAPVIPAPVMPTPAIPTPAIRTPATPTPVIPTQMPPDKSKETACADPVSSWRDPDTPTNPSPSATVPSNTYIPPPYEIKPVSTPPPEVSSLDFNSYGGKTITVNPSASSRRESVTTDTSDTLPSALANPIEFNNYGGKSKVLTPAPVPMPRHDLPDILSSHIDTGRSVPSPTKPEVLPYEFNSYGGKTRTITPSSSSNPPAHTPVKNPKAPAPAPAPKPVRHHGPPSSPCSPISPCSPSPHKPFMRPPSPEFRQKPTPKSSIFRSQGVTVQFSGRGQTDESRKEALRKLGLLKDC